MKNLFKSILPILIVGLFIGTISYGATVFRVFQGGTGIGTYNRGDLLIATTTSQLYRLATGTESQVLTITSGIPAWAVSTGGITSLNGLTDSTQTFASTSETNLGITITSSGSTHTFAPYWIGTLADGRIASAATWNAKQDALSFPLAYASTTHITATTPLTISSGVLSMPTSTDSQSGYLSSADWTTFNAKGSGTVTSVAMTTPTGLTISGSPITISGTLALSLTSGYVIPLTASTTDWNTAYTDRLKWDGGAAGLVAATGRTSLELGTMSLLANTGSTTITTLGTIATGIWSGTSITDAKIDDNITLTNITQITNRAITDTSGILGYARGGTGLDMTPYTGILRVDSGVFSTTTVAGGGVATTSPFTSGYIPYTTSSLALTDSTIFQLNGNVGIGTTEPAYKLDVNGNLRATLSLTAGINVEATGTSTATTLIPGTDKMSQYLIPSDDRSITLATSTAQAGDKFIIRNNGNYDISFNLRIYQGADTLDNIYAQATREYVFNGTNWVAGDNTTGISTDYNTAIGYSASGYTYGVAVGRWATGHTYGTAVGYGTTGHTYGTAMGYNADGNTYGVAVGGNACGYTYGTVVGSDASGDNHGAAVGYGASGETYGTAVGSNAWGHTHGAAVGYDARGYNYGAAVGRDAKGMRYGVALGYQAGYNIDTSADRYNIVVGSHSGYRLTTGIGNTIIGYQAGYDTIYSPITGNKNILIGFQAGTPATTTSNFLNIGNLIFATGVNTASSSAVSTGNVGIGTTTPAYLLDVYGNARLGTSTASSLFFRGLSNFNDNFYIDASGNVATGTWQGTPIDISSFTNLAAGRSLTMSGDSVEADVELFTDSKCMYIENPVATDDLKSLWRSSIAITFTKIWAESDQTVTFNLQEDDDTPANILSESLAPAAGTASSTSFADANFAAGSRLDLVVDSVANTPTWISICFDYVKDD